MQLCPYCSNPMVRQVNHGRITWFCRHCWIDLPADCIALHEFKAPKALTSPS